MDGPPLRAATDVRDAAIAPDAWPAAAGLRSWPVADRPRERLFSKGVAALSNTELLAVLLRSRRYGEGL